MLHLEARASQYAPVLATAARGHVAALLHAARVTDTRWQVGTPGTACSTEVTRCPFQGAGKRNTNDR
eukprot:4716285-Lingulodinium_polyedra.AAC.1